MHCTFSATVIAAFSVISIASAGPIATRQVCGAAPVGTVAQTPLSQPTGITTASACAAQCKGNPACLSFLFGLVNGVDKCMLYSVPASSLPPQANLVAYDIGCTSIPAVVPTADNPGGLRTRQASGTHANPINSVPAGNPTPLAQPTVDNLSACLAACKGNPSCVAYTFTSGQCKLFGAAVGRRQSGASAQGGAASGSGNTVENPSTGSTASATQVGTHANPINATPAGASAPIATPQVDDLSACLAACKGNPSCIAYTFESGVCKLFGPATTRRRSPTNGAQGQTAASPAQGQTGTQTQATGGQVGTHAAPVNAIPAGSPAPIATPKVDNLSACLAACKGNSACIAYTFESGVCKLFD